MKPDDMTMNEVWVCRVIGELFAESVEKGYNSEKFIEAYMKSETVNRGLDNPGDGRLHTSAPWLMEELEGEIAFEKGETWPGPVMEWIGYMYKYWQYVDEVGSARIYEIADARAMRRSYGLHMASCDRAIEELKESAGARDSGKDDHSRQRRRACR